MFSCIEVCFLSSLLREWCLGSDLVDLLNYTPATSPSRALVQRAVEAACRIAQKCDRAQGNATFLQQ
jgi:hypothetical protein